MPTFGGAYRSKVRKVTAKQYVSDRTTSTVTGKSAITQSRQQPADYLKTLMSPHAFRGVKIPDLACYPTCTFSEVDTFTWNAATSGTVADSGNLMVVGLCGQSFNQIGVIGGKMNTQARLTSTLLNTRYRAVRLVSAEVIVTYTGNGDTNQGLITCGYRPAGVTHVYKATAVAGTTDLSVGWSETGSAGSYKDYFDSYRGPLKLGASIIYKPVDSQSFEFQDQIGYTTSSDRVAQVARLNYTNEGSATAFGKDGFGSIYCVIENPGANCQFNVTVTTNFEAIPLDENQTEVVTNSPSNSGALSASLQAVSGVASGGPSSSAGDRMRLAKTLR